MSGVMWAFCGKLPDAVVAPPAAIYDVDVADADDVVAIEFI